MKANQTRGAPKPLVEVDLDIKHGIDERLDVEYIQTV
jgi:hypothetical protein